MVCVVSSRCIVSDFYTIIIIIYLFFYKITIYFNFYIIIKLEMTISYPSFFLFLLPSSITTTYTALSPPCTTYASSNIFLLLLPEYNKHVTQNWTNKQTQNLRTLYKVEIYKSINQSKLNHKNMIKETKIVKYDLSI